MRVFIGPTVLFVVSAMIACQAPATPATNSPSSTAHMVRAPFVGCSSDGQQGPKPAPADDGKAPLVADNLASHLAYYRSANLGVLGPSGWVCLGLYGSNGTILLVAPKQEEAAMNHWINSPGLTGPAIQLSFSYGDTSGRFTVAKVAVRLFPTEKAYVQKVIDEHIEPASAFPFGPYPGDTIIRKDDRVVEFTTPGNSDGFGLVSRLAKNADPISGVAMINDDGLIKLDVRVPAAQRDIVRTIIGTIEKRDGLFPQMQ